MWKSKLHSLEQPMGQKRNQDKLEIILRQMRIKHTYQNVWDAAKGV